MDYKTLGKMKSALKRAELEDCQYDLIQRMMQEAYRLGRHAQKKGDYPTPKQYINGAINKACSFYNF